MQLKKNKYYLAFFLEFFHLSKALTKIPEISFSLYIFLVIFLLRTVAATAFSSYAAVLKDIISSLAIHNKKGKTPGLMR